jgi:2-amino-4-hydroxy-6-hydroxymethyldihydropteridine diphosphokinase
MGTNVGDDLFKNLDEARGYIGKIPHTRILKKSSIHQTVPLLMVDQRDFLNQCLLIETWLHPEQFLQHTQRIERDMGRVPTAVNGPRIIDIDLLAFNGFTSVGPFLVLPHPALNSRRFLIDEFGDYGIKIRPKYGSDWWQKCEKVQ